MAEAEQMGVGPATSDPSEEPGEQAGVATARAPSTTAAPVPADASRAAAGSAASTAPALDREPSASVRGVPSWSFTAPASGAAPTPNGPVPDAPSAGAAENPPAGFPPPPPAPPTLGAVRVGRSPAVQLLTVPSLGPSGEPRHPAAVVAISVLTLGAYTVGWHARVNREMSDFDARLEVRPRVSALGVALAWVIGLLTTLAGAGLVLAHVLRLGLSLPRFASGPSALGVTVPWAYLLLCGLIAVPYLVLLLPTSAVALVMTLERMRLVQERVGFRSDRQIRPVRRAGILLIPVVGGLWHVASVQASLNRVWQATPPLPPPPGPRRR